MNTHTNKMQWAHHHGGKVIVTDNQSDRPFDQKEAVSAPPQRDTPRFTAKQIQKRISEHKYVDRDMSAVIRCPICGKLISTRFPMHDCKP